MVSYLGILFCIASVLHSTNAFCERLYKNPFWTPKSLSQRAVDADIVIYGNVIESPCVKPIFVAQNFTTAPPTNATNSTSSSQPVTPNIQPVTNSSVNITQGNTTDICLMRGLYNVTIDVLCVIKGGSVPYKLHLRSFGFGPEKCVYYHRGYNYWEIMQSFHVYKGLNYLIFLGRWVKKKHFPSSLCPTVVLFSDIFNKIQQIFNFDYSFVFRHVLPFVQICHFLR